MTDKQKTKIIRKIDNAIDKFVSIAMLILLFIGSWFVYDSAYVFNNASAAKVRAFKPEVVNAETLMEVGEDCVAWIEVEDTKLDFPIMQGEDNSEYLNKAPDGSYSLAGSIFLDSRNSPDFSDPYSLVYGHHMENAMFSCIDAWEDEEYFNKYKVGKLTVGDKEYEYRIFAFIHSDAYIEEIFSPTDHYPLDYIRSAAKNFREPEGNILLACSTCTSPTSTKRTVIVGSLHLK